MKQILFIVFAIVFFLACGKKNAVNEQADFCKNGYIYWGGPYEADGVGWYFAENRDSNRILHQLKADELPAAYKPNYTDSTAVTICLKKTTERSPCFCSVPGYFYHITFIRKR